MNAKQVDYLIVGQGIAGTLLSAALLRRGATICVLSPGQTQTASMLSSALIHPLAGRKLRQRPTIASELNAALVAYKDIETKTGQTVVMASRLLHMHRTVEERDLFVKEYKAGNQYVAAATSELAAASFFADTLGAHEIAPVYRIFPEILLSAWNSYLQEQNLLLEEQFAYTQLRFSGRRLLYQGIQASALIFCEGNHGRNNPFFPATAMNKNRGEFLLLSIPDLDESFIYQGPLRLVPKGKGIWWCGSNYRWDYEDLTPDVQWRDASLEQLRQWLRLPFTLLDHCVAERPTTIGQMPLLLQHREHRQLFFFNGLGTRGFSAGPLLAEQMADQVIQRPGP